MRPLRRIVLVGFMGAGKTTVGRILADRLGWRFVDLDQRIEELAGRTIAQIFENDGESTFRRLEAEATATLDAEGDVVLATGGGWVVHSGLLESLDTRDVVVWLRVSADEAVRRVSATGPTRPLLGGQDPLADAAMLVRQREPYYRLAHIAIDTERHGPEAVAEMILDQLEDRTAHGEERKTKSARDRGVAGEGEDDRPLSRR
ncbi:MAG: shikimate kinase [Longimicrobiales bacterium]